MTSRRIDYKRHRDSEIGRLPEEWEIANLGEVSTDFISGGTPSTKNPKYWNGNIPWMTSAHINGRTIITGTKNITEEGLNNSASNIVPKNSILLATRVGIGKVAINLIDIAISQDLTGIVPNPEKINPDFIYWFISNNPSKLKARAQGSTIKGLLRTGIEKLNIPLPPLPEQRKIAQILSTVDDAIQKVGDAIAKTERLKQGLMQELLTKGIGHERFKDSEVERIPEGWEVVELGNVGEVFTGKTPSTSNDAYWNGKIQFITPGDIQDTKYVYNTKRHVTLDGTDQVGRILPKDTVLTVCIGSTIGKTALTYTKCITNQQINAVICRDNFAYPHYVYYALSFREKLLKSYSGVAAVPIIKKSLFECFNIPLPPLPEQQKIAQILSTVDKKLELENKRKQKLERIKKGLMNDLLTGRKRVKIKV